MLIRHFITILDTGWLGTVLAEVDSLTARRTVANFEKMHWEYLRYLPSNYRRPDGLSGFKSVSSSGIPTGPIPFWVP